MKFIKKQEEPVAFLSWKRMGNEYWEPTWNNLRDDASCPDLKPKTALHEALLCEQGYICGYCGRRVSRTSSHIDHVKPRKTYPELCLTYANLIASCHGYLEEEDSRALTESQAPQQNCGHKKDDWYDIQLMVSPLTSDCEDYFTYTASGEICPVKDTIKKPASHETILKLGLNSPKLMRAREKAIEAILLSIDGLSTEEIQKLIYSCEQPDEEGKYIRFCGAVLYFLRKYGSL